MDFWQFWTELKLILDRIWTLFRFILMILSRFRAVWSRLWTKKDGHILDTHFRHSLDGFLTYFERNLSWFWTESGHFFRFFYNDFKQIGTDYEQKLDIFWIYLDIFHTDFGHILSSFGTYFESNLDIFSTYFKPTFNRCST